MSDETIIIMPDGGRWKPATSVDTIQCHNCDNLVDTPEEVASYPDGNCPDCGCIRETQRRNENHVMLRTNADYNGYDNSDDSDDHNPRAAYI